MTWGLEHLSFEIRRQNWANTRANSTARTVSVNDVAACVHYLTKIWICKKLLRYKWTSDQLNTFFLTFWLVCCVTSQKVRKKVFNWSEVHFYQSNILQNPYFNTYFKGLLSLFIHFLKSANFRLISEVTIYLSWTRTWYGLSNDLGQMLHFKSPEYFGAMSRTFEDSSILFSYLYSEGPFINSGGILALKCSKIVCFPTAFLDSSGVRDSFGLKGQIEHSNSFTISAWTSAPLLEIV